MSDDIRSFQSVECVECHGTFTHNTATYYEEVDGYVCDDCVQRYEDDYDDSVDETNYDPYLGCDSYEYDPI